MNACRFVTKRCVLFEMSEPQDGIDLYWRWFEAHLSDFDALEETGDAFWDEAVHRLQELDGRLWFELASPGDEDREFIITAEGHADVFLLVEAIIARAPRLTQ
jgi:hypothetical protein